MLKFHIEEVIQSSLRYLQMIQSFYNKIRSHVFLFFLSFILFLAKINQLFMLCIANFITYSRKSPVTCQD